MTGLLNTTLCAGVLAGVTIVTGAAPATAASVTETSAESISIFHRVDTAASTGTLTFNGFSGPGTLTGVVMTLNSSIYGPTGEGLQIDGAAEIAFAGGVAGLPYSVYYSSQSFNISADLLARGNPFGAPISAADFTGPVVTFDLSLFGTSQADYSDVRWTGDPATLEYIYTSSVPLPAALPLMAIGLGALGFAARRRG